MDKKKVMELIGNVEKYLLAYEKSGKNADIAMAFQQLHEAEDELSKPDWISVEDELPPLGDVVQVRSKQNPNDLMLACRTDESTMKTVYPLIKFYSQDITHWRKIDKLEV